VNEIDKIRRRIQIVWSDPVAYFGQRWTTTSKVEPQRVDQAWMSLVLQWLQTWRFTPAQAEHLMVIIRGQTASPTEPK